MSSQPKPIEVTTLGDTISRTPKKIRVEIDAEICSQPAPLKLVQDYGNIEMDGNTYKLRTGYPGGGCLIIISDKTNREFIVDFHGIFEAAVKAGIDDKEDTD